MKMDYVLNILIPKNELETVNLKEELIEWGGNLYSCDPPLYITDSDIVFEQIEDVRYFYEIVGEKLTNDIIALNLKSNILFELEYAVNNDVALLGKNTLFVFLNKLFKLSEFYIILVREDEKVKERYRIVAKEEISIRLSDSLRWSNPKDVLLFKKNQFSTIFNR